MSIPRVVAILMVAAALIAVAWLGGLPDLLRWDRLLAWRGWVAVHPWPAGAAYVLVYAGFVSASLPAGGILSIAGGALFGAFPGAALAVTGASAGAVALFLLARGTLGRLLAARARPLLDRVRPALEQDGFWGLLAMRLIPVVPFWLGNLAPALLGMRLVPYAAATVIGIVPATAVLAGLGAGFADVLAAGGTPDAGVLLTPRVLLPILGLALLSMAPIAARRWRTLPWRSGHG